MGFSYKTSWLAVRDRSPAEVADALNLVEREAVGWIEGTRRAYQRGVYVAAPQSGWTLAHGARHLPVGFDATCAAFPDWLAGLSERLGEVQFFGTHRVVEYHAWAWARDGHITRAYSYLGERGEVSLFLGEPTTAERDADVGTRPLEEGFENWSESDWEAWHKTTPNEQDVMRIAGAWSLDPDTIDDQAVVGLGLHGVPAQVSHQSSPRFHRT